MNRLLLMFTTVILLVNVAHNSENNSPIPQLNHGKRIYVDPNGKTFIAQELPIYLHFSTTPQTTEHTILNDVNATALPMFLSEGPNTIRNPNAMGNGSQTYIIYADATAPRSNVSFTGAKRYTNNTGIIYGRGLSFDIPSNDDLSGVFETYISHNGNIYKPFEQGLLDFSQNSEFILEYYSVDNVGNVEYAKKTRFFVDA
ncbi:MAG: hypothetical protein P9M15_03235, partial [Candidatus Electryoneaceae bacterium]|nr:hypothetical protein [Candidatus Electryoneaceae bacterium]